MVLRRLKLLVSVKYGWVMCFCLILGRQTLYPLSIEPGAVYVISTQDTGNRVLSVDDSSLDDMASVVAWTDTKVNAQKWRAVECGEPGAFCFVNIYTGMVLHRVGTGLYQTLNDVSETTRWVVEETEEGDSLFYMKVFSTSSYLRIKKASVTDIDGVNITVGPKKEGDPLLLWKFEKVEEPITAFNEEWRDDVFRSWEQGFVYSDGYGGKELLSTGFWGVAESMEVLLDAYETSGDLYYKTLFEEVYKSFTRRNTTNWMGNEYNDDIAWAVIACVRAHLLFGDSKYLSVARMNFDKMYQRALIDDECGLLRWKEGTGNGSTSCIDGPAEVAACYLAIATGEDRYYEIAKDLYGKQRKYLYETDTGKVYDSYGCGSTVGSWSSTYNQGTFLGAAVMLYNHYGEETYRSDAEKIMEFTQKHLCNHHEIINVCGGGADLPGFKGILMRYVRRYIVDLRKTDAVDWMQKNAVHAYNNRNSKGYIWTAWWEKSTENSLWNESQAYDAFGAGTAVSLVFNTPLDKALIIKDAYQKIPAGSFNYIKGVSLNGGVVEVMNDQDRVTYSNVDFGNQTATKIKFGVTNTGSAAGEIELRKGSDKGVLLAVLTIPDNQGGNEYDCDLSKVVDGMENITLVFKGKDSKMQLNYLQFFAGDQIVYTDATNSRTGVLSASRETENGYGLSNLIDNKMGSKMSLPLQGSSEPVWIQYESALPISLKGYTLVSSEEEGNANPESWKLQASSDGKQWIDIDSRENQNFSSPYQSHRYAAETGRYYAYYRLWFESLTGNTFSLSEWQLFGSALSENSITNDGGAVSSAEPEAVDGLANLIDNDIESSCLVDGQTTCSLQYAAKGRYLLEAYSISVADDPSIDPKSWVLYASTDNVDWVEADRQTSQQFPYRNSTAVYSCALNTPYQYFKLQINESNGANSIKMAEWQLLGAVAFDSYVPDLTANGGTLTSSEGADKLSALTDDSPASVCSLDFSRSSEPWVQYESAVKNSRLRGYSVTAGKNAAAQPSAWVLEGSANGSDWIRIDNRENVVFSSYYEKKVFELSVSSAYSHYRLKITSLNGEATVCELAELELYATAIASEAENNVAVKGLITADSEGNDNEGYENLADGKENTKYCISNKRMFRSVCQLPHPVKLAAYTLTSANDNQRRDPESWTLSASQDGVEWVELDSREDQYFPFRHTTQFYSCSMEEACSYFKLDVSENSGDVSVQLSEWALIEGVSSGMHDQRKDADWLSLYSNIVSDFLQIQVCRQGRISIYDMNGNTMLKGEFLPGEYNLNVTNYSAGLYVIVFESGGFVSKKFVKR